MLPKAPLAHSRQQGKDFRRLDIQGLRAVAVVLVMVFHSGLPLPGGFVGVDVFFAISGFVITGMIAREWSATGRFAFGRFYLRRFKRLAPAMALMIVVTMLLTSCLLSPFNVQQVAAKTGIGAGLLAANFVIAINTGNYFSAPAESNPLLHTWSLSVEEQFYLAFPTLLLLAWILARRRNQRIASAALYVSTIALASFGLTLTGGVASQHPDIVGFYSPFARAWEFAAGSLLALAARDRSLPFANHARVLAWFGVAMLVGSAFLINQSTPFPGPWTILPVVGTLLVIAAGTERNTLVTRALSVSAVVKIGDLSYSLYLWHWPVRVFAVHLWPGSPLVAVVAITLSVIPAAACYRWVENPIRRLRQTTRQRTAALFGAVMIPSLLVAVLTLVTANHYWLPHYKSGSIKIAHRGDIDWTDYFLYMSRNYYPCTDQAIRENSLKWEGITRCRQSKADSRIDIALVGDSHAEQLFVGLAEAAPDKNIVYYVVAARPIRSDEDATRIIEHVSSDPAIRTVIVTANWTLRGVPHDDLVATFEAFTSKGKAVFTTDDVPTFPFDAVSCGYRIAPILPQTRCSMDRKRFEAVHNRYYPDLEDAVRSVPGVRLLNTAAYFCDASLCRMNRGDDLLYRDSDHVNNVGSSFLARQLVANYPEFGAQLHTPPQTAPGP
ncbi:acyltransferase family protein [Mycobacterium sp. 23]|uniref:acyltransferase family protein n=1 Tax=Mycobacterium sp. 23 TaxID=3400424 RepID=UPI003AB0788C